MQDYIIPLAIISSALYLTGVVRAITKRRDYNRVIYDAEIPFWVVWTSWVAVYCINSELKN